MERIGTRIYLILNFTFHENLVRSSYSLFLQIYDIIKLKYFENLIIYAGTPQENLLGRLRRQNTSVTWSIV